MTVAVLALAGCASQSPSTLPVAASVAPAYDPRDIPEIRDWGSLKITLSRGPCLGPCPVYELAIAGEGTVTYCGIQFVEVAGLRTKMIPRESVHALLAKFSELKYFELADSYIAPVTDMPWHWTSISFDGQRKQVAEYLGESVGMPPSVIELEEMIDALAGTAAWVGDIRDFNRQNRTPVACEGQVAPSQ